MTVAELIAELERFDEDAEVHLATQPSYPLEAQIATVTCDEDSGTVYVAEGSFVGYATPKAWA